MENVKNLKFDIQRFWRDPEDVTYRGRRRWSGNWGRVWINGEMVFEISSFECKVNIEREDVWIGNSKDSKVTGLVGEGTLTIKKVYDNGLQAYLENQKAGHDERVTLIGRMADPDTIGGQQTQFSVDNVWFNDLDILHFSKNEMVETEIPFGFTPEDVQFQSIVSK